MHSTRGIRAAAAVVSLFAVAACSSCRSSGDGDGDDNRISLERLRQSTSDCPLPLAAAVRDAGPTPQPSVSVAPPSAAGSGTVLQQIGGVSVECTVGSAAGSLSVFLVAATKANAAAPSLLPLLGYRGDITQNELRSVASAIPDTEAGDLVPLNAGNGQAALGIVTVDGARSAAFVLFSKDAEPDTVRRVAERLADRLD